MPTITGTDNDDLLDLSLSTNDNTIFGGTNTDATGGGVGNDVALGIGLGNDSILGGGISPAFQIDDLIFGGAGDDTINSNYGNDTVYGGDGDDLLDSSNIVAAGSVHTVYGDSGDDSIFGQGGDDIIYGGTGNDNISSNFAQLSPNPGGDTVYGGAGDDTITTDALNGTDSSVGDTVYGGAGNDSITGAIENANPDADDDFLYGGDGNDVIDGNRGTDFIDAGGGNDTVLARAGGDTTDGGAGVDLIDFSGDTGAVNFDMTSGATTITGTAPVESNVNYENVIGSSSADTILGNAADNSISGGAGADLLTGGTGNDTFVSGAGADSIEGGEDGPANPDGSIDVVDYSGETNGVTVRYTGDEAGTAQGTSTGTDTFIEIERIVFTDQADAVNAFNDTVGVTLNTGAGDDFVEAGQGNDSLDGGDGIDELSYADSTGAVTVNAGAGTATGGSGDDVFANFEDYTLSSGGDRFNGPLSGSVTVDGGAGNDTLLGGGSSDTVIGGDGEDLVIGGLGDDSISAGAGNDTIIAVGNDSIDGGGTGSGTSPGDFDVLDVASAVPPGGSFRVVPGAGNDAGVVQIFDGPNGTGNIVNTINFVEIESVVCFTRGTMIATPDGERSIEDLGEGDLVLTRDHGPRPIRWIGSRTTPAAGKLAPVVIAEGALGNDRELRVSQLHRMLITDWRAELMFGEPEVLAAAKHLVNGDTIYVAEGGEVEYFHMLFDSHELVTANGAVSESFHPGEQGMSWLEDEVREEIFTIFPELRDNVEGYGPAARTSLRAYEARALRR